MDGRANEYHGVAIHPKHLSLWETLWGDHKNYNPEADFKQKVDEMRQEWEERQRAKFSENESSNKDFDDEDDLEKTSPRIHQYFIKTSPHMSPMYKPQDISSAGSGLDDLTLPEAAKN